MRCCRTSTRHRTMLRSKFALLLLCVFVAPDAMRSRQTRVPALDVIEAFDRIARADLWPGFRPDTIPLAIFDGTRTWLAHHPSPPAEFASIPIAPGILVMEGRHPAVTANSTATIGGRTVATLIPKQTERNAAGWASVAAHEAFHAFQRIRHPSWQANEATLFTYPWEQVDALAARRLEFEALRRALAAPDEATAACWASVAMGTRNARFAAIGADAAAYERRSELNEGTAQYVQLRAAGTDALSAMPTTEFAPSGVRDRVYAAGAAMGQLLDRLHPSWRQELELADSAASVDDALRKAAVGRAAVPRCDFASLEREQARATAVRDIEKLRRTLATMGKDYLTRPGWSVVIDAGRSLDVSGFDPLNVARLSATAVLHMRYIKLQNDAGVFESIGHAVLTEAAGNHPLFSGVRRVVMTGLQQAPVVEETGDALKLKIGEAMLSFRGASLHRDGQRLTVRIPAR